ncbi:hypothetical protein [Shewanella sp. KCT]|uniref:hypothetical protein n=1 Tax=Shewanella sp. KCT TaxID=2569535 RepID=UPI001182F4DB|nr:hypothetical protein [Shewanella sp. KCT]TVP15385.1 hypothetical protein AYI87_06885 [Shewanella sp. KCT]
MAKLNKGELEGIRLLADLFVIRDLQKNVLSKHAVIVPHLEELESNLKKAVPKVFAAEVEFKKQINQVRKYWLQKLTEGECHD